MRSSHARLTCLLSCVATRSNWSGAVRRSSSAWGQVLAATVVRHVSWYEKKPLLLIRTCICTYTLCSCCSCFASNIFRTVWEWRQQVSDVCVRPRTRSQPREVATRGSLSAQVLTPLNCPRLSHKHRINFLSIYCTDLHEKQTICGEPRWTRSSNALSCLCAPNTEANSKCDATFQSTCCDILGCFLYLPWIFENFR